MVFKLVIRELLVSLGFNYDKSKADAAEKDIKQIKTEFTKVEQSSNKTAQTVNRNMDKGPAKPNRAAEKLDVLPIGLKPGVIC